jgi:hypothetical protein
MRQGLRVGWISSKDWEPMSRYNYWSQEMSQHDRTTGNAITREVPLFASSWMALFMLLRDNFNRNDARNPSVMDTNGAKLTRAR